MVKLFAMCIHSFDAVLLNAFSSQIAINSTITATMVFAKTSQKFGQWADTRAATVYGLGFTNEGDLTKVHTLLMIEIFIKNIC